MKIKPGVSVSGMRPEILLAISIAEGVFRQNGSEAVITSVVDGKHGRASLHYVGLAVDFRTRDFSLEAKHKITRELDDALGMILM